MGSLHSAIRLGNDVYLNGNFRFLAISILETVEKPPYNFLKTPEKD